MLKNLASELRSWSTRKIGSIKEQLLMAREIILRYDLAAEQRTLSAEERSLRADLKVRVLGLSSLERTIARQRARVRYLADGDANTKYFHMLARGRKRRQLITKLKLNDVLVTSHQEMAEGIYEHFRDVFGRAERHALEIDFQALGISAVNLQELDAPFTEDEIWAAIRELPPDRAPGPDGFTGAFYKASWSFIKHEVMAAVGAFSFGDSRAFGRLNSALVVLLLKHPEAACPTDYRPITMIHCIAKLVSKALALWLTPKMQLLVSPNQNVFIRGRTIHDSSKMVQRAAVLLRNRRIPNVLIKVDISKAFNTIGWLFLLDVLRAFVFGISWTRWITTLLTTATSRILLNGQPGNPITHRRGVRQGDSLSPLLFILGMEVLSRLFSKAHSDRVIRGPGLPAIRHHCSIYADDVILFAHPDRHEARAVRRILEIFGDASGLKTNLAKCSIMEIFGAGNEIDRMQQILGCSITKFPIRYLGLPLSTAKVPKLEIRKTVDAVARRLQPSHGPLMAKSGRLV